MDTNQRGSGEITIGETLAKVATIPCLSKKKAFFNFSVADNALDQFEIRGKAGQLDTAGTLANATGDYTSPSGDIIGASGDLTIASTTGQHWVRLDVEGYHDIEIWAASGNAAGSRVTWYASAS